ncbi:MAG: AAA family ATPase [Desulfurococcaceae archaeon]
MKRLYIVVAGMPGSGKSIVIEAAKKLSLPVYSMGDVVREETMRRYGTISPDLMVETSRKLREEYGEEIIAIRTHKKIHEKDHIVVIDGVRSIREIEFFKRTGNVVIIAVHASPNTRFRRLIARKRPGDPIKYEDFIKRDLTELKFGLGNVIALADYMIINEGSIDEALNRSISLLRSLVEKHGRDNC